MQQITTDPYCFFPSRRTAPPELVRQLRLIEPSAELVWLRRGQWCLGTVKRDTMHVAVAQRSYEILTKAGEAIDRSNTPAEFREQAVRIYGDKIAFQRLKMQGFVDQVTFAPMSDAQMGLIVRWLKEAKWVKQHAFNQMMNAMEHSLDVNPESDAKMKELTDTARLTDAWRHGFRRPKSFTRTGLVPSSTVRTSHAVHPGATDAALQTVPYTDKRASAPS